MKFIHLSDLHIGKRVHGISMLEDQEYILKKILNIVDEQRPDAVLIAGDVYDKSVPPAEAVPVFDKFLVELAKLKIKVFIISGNHDSAERLSFGGRLMEESGVYISPVYNNDISPITLKDPYGELNIYLLPFIRPADVRRFFPDESIESYTDAVDTVIKHMNIDTSKRNILVAHQFVTGAQRCESENVSIGGTDNVDASVFEPFDYVALGHLHGPQSVGRETIRYCGTPLKYSFSECMHKKSVTVVELSEKGSPVNISVIPLLPRHDMREIKGSYDELTLRKNYENTETEDYIHITLTDEDDIPNVFDKLRIIYKNALLLDYDNRRTRSSSFVADTADLEKSPLELFEELYEQQNNRPMSDEQQSITEELIREIWEVKE